MEMQFKNEINKLADVVVWADNWIGKLKSCLTEEEFTEDEEVKAFEIVKKVILESMERHTVYTNALNKDIADKAAKIDLLEKEIEGRKEGYWALKEKMDTQYISVDDHNDVCEAYEKKVAELKEEVKKRDKCIMEKNAIINTAAKMKEDDYGKSGFKRYIEHLIEEEERAVPERFKERLNKEITEIFTKEEETVKYRPSEIDRFVNFLKDEVDKKRIVDISEGAEKILGVSRELFDAAIKALVDDGYQEIIGRIPQATNSYVYMDMHVLATPDVETKETANAENIKSLDFDIPCGEDAIE